jgi:hypothetical protein
MCRLSSSQYDHYRRTDPERGRSLLAWLRELWARGRPKPAAAEVLPFPSEAAKRADPKAEHGGSKAA